MSPNEQLKDAILVFRQNPLVKLVAKTKMGDLHQLQDSMPEEDLISLFRAFRTFSTDPLVRRVMVANGVNKSPKEFRPHAYEGLSLLRNIKEVLSSGSRMAKGQLSAEIKKDLVNWVQQNEHMIHLDDYAINILLATPGIRPETNIILYRGLLFQNWQFDPKRQNHTKAAGPIVDSLLAGKQHIVIDDTKVVSWTTSVEIADRFATSKPSSSQYLAMQSWLREKGRINGKLGIILATLARPHDVLLDLSKVDLGWVTHGDEGEMLLVPGKRVVRIMTILTPDGEISIEEFPEYIQKIIDAHSSNS